MNSETIKGVKRPFAFLYGCSCICYENSVEF